MKRIFLFMGMLLFALSACNKDTAPEYNTTLKAPLSVEFDNIAGESDLQLNTGTYTTAAGESFKVTRLKYYVSNFAATKSDGTVYTVPSDSCYFLVDESIAGTHSPILQLPEGEYKTLTFILGVDSVRNTMDISKRTGVLDPTGAAADMYWGWNSGYIFFKIEGTSTALPAGGNVFQYHVGGFGGYNSPTPNNIKTISLDLSARGSAKVKSGKETNIHLFVDILKVFSGTTNTSFTTIPMIHSALPGVPVAKNYTGMFRHDHTEN